MMSKAIENKKMIKKIKKMLIIKMILQVLINKKMMNFKNYLLNLMMSKAIQMNNLKFKKSNNNPNKSNNNPSSYLKNNFNKIVILIILP